MVGDIEMAFPSRLHVRKAVLMTLAIPEWANDDACDGRREVLTELPLHEPRS